MWGSEGMLQTLLRKIGTPSLMQDKLDVVKQFDNNQSHTAEKEPEAQLPSTITSYWDDVDIEATKQPQLKVTYSEVVKAVKSLKQRDDCDFVLLSRLSDAQKRESDISKKDQRLVESYLNEQLAINQKCEKRIEDLLVRKSNLESGTESQLDSALNLISQKLTTKSTELTEAERREHEAKLV